MLARSVPPREARRPVTLGVGEPFTATVRVAAYAALLLALPILLFQAYAFVLPAFSREERNVALPLMAMVPFLFIAGVVFAYFMILPNAIDFLQNFNDDNFDILLQAKDYYRFAIMLMIVMGVCFQVPVGILAFTRLGIVSVAQLRHSRRYTIIGIAVVAMLLPGQDPVTMLSLMAPLYVLFEGSILLASLIERRAEKRADPTSPTTSKPERMLFDLRGAGRRRTVKVVYITLAFLMGGGLVLFGIGGDVSGGLVDAITERGGGGDDGSDRFRKQEAAALKRTQANPQDAAAWAALARARFQLAGIGENFDPAKGTFTKAGTAKLTSAGDAWEPLPGAGTRRSPTTASPA